MCAFESRRCQTDFFGTDYKLFTIRGNVEKSVNSSNLKRDGFRKHVVYTDGALSHPADEVFRLLEANFNERIVALGNPKPKKYGH